MGGKHHEDLQKDLYNFEMVLDNRSTLSAFCEETVKAYGPRDTTFSVWHSKEWRGTPLNLHVSDCQEGWEYTYIDGFQYTYYSLWCYDSFEKMCENEGCTIFTVDPDNTITFNNHSGAPVGNRPLYYHVYKSGNYYYLQYWYYFTMNDLRYDGQTKKKTWHESDWEHVAIKLQKSGDNFTPVAVNFYIHTGGQTLSPDNCWWSSSNATTYSGIQKGYDENHTHLHIWLSKNAHASYNRYEPVYQYKLNWQYSGTEVIEDYIDNVDYSPSGYDEYFPYDFLEKLGEVDRGDLVTPRGNSKYWIAFEGRFGTYWTITIPFYGPVGTPSPGPLTMNGENHEYYAFTQGAFEYHWGFDKAKGDIRPLTDAHFYWKPDPPRGD